MTLRDKLKALKREQIRLRELSCKEAGRLERIWEVSRKLRNLETELLKTQCALTRKIYTKPETMGV